MVSDQWRLKALRDCCQDEAAFERLRQLLPPACLDLGQNSELPHPPLAESPGQPDAQLIARQIELEQQVATYATQLQLQSQELQQLQKLKQVVWSTIAHDLRTSVMGTVLAFKQLLKQPGDSLNLPRSMAERIVRGGDRHLNLLNSLLETCSCQEQGIALSLRPTNFGGLVEAIAQRIQPFLRENQATLNNQVPLDLPLVNADPTQIQRVFEHLLCNILKHHPPDLHLTIRATVAGQLLRCDIQNNESSLNQDDCNRLFELQIRTPQSRCSTGIGVKLYLCRQIITTHGGQIGAFSSPERGTTFWFTLPLITS